jgi:hypothetical protein
MPTDEHRREHAINDFIVPDDDATDLLADGSVSLSKTLRFLLHGFGDVAHGYSILSRVMRR